MQRINWFPDPNITGTAKPVAGNNARIDYPFINNRNWLRATSTATGNNYAQYSLAGSQLPPAGTYHVHAWAYAQSATADFQIYVRVAGTYSMILDVPVGDGMTITIDRNITIPSNTDQMLIRIALDQTTVGMKGMMSDILIERADTYATAVGGASGLLHRGHDATRLRRLVGRVMPDDGHEYRQQSDRHNHSESRRVDTYNQRPEQGQHEILRQRLSARQRRLHRCDLQWARNNQLRSTCQLPDNKLKRKSDGHELQRRVRQSDRDSDEYAHLHVCRLSGEQDSARPAGMVRRGQHAARLTLMGVVA